MSTSHNVKIIYGFWCDNPVIRDRKTGQPTYLADWLAENGFHTIGQINAGKSNGGSPDFFVGVEIVGANDYTRSNTPYAAVPNPLPWPRETAAILDAHAALSALDPDLLKPDVPLGFYLIGDAA